MKNDLIIRRLSKDDLKQGFELRLESLQDAPANFMTSYEEEKLSGFPLYQNILNNDETNNVIFGTFIERKLVGMLGICQENRSKTKHKAIIWGMYVQPAYRNQGFGKALFKEVLEYAKHSIKCSVINLTVEENNTSAKELYKAFGFKEWGMEPQAMQMDGHYFNECHMSLIMR